MLASRLFRSGFLLMPMLVAAAYAAGCSDDDPATPAGSDDGGAKTDGQATDGGNDGGGVVVDPRCATDKDVKDGLFKHLACAGLYSNASTKTVAAENIEYKPSTEFWSDGAEKTRWFSLPAGQKIDTSNMNEWVFPVGTKVFKQFKLGGKLIETRLLQKFDDEWKSTTYRWNADESDAQRLEEGEQVPGLGPDGGVYEIPNTTYCSQCHGGRKDFLLGFDAVSLGLPNATGLTLDQLVSKKMLTNDPPLTKLAYPAATAPQGGDKAGPAMAWLHINCGTACHNRNPNAGAAFSSLFMQIRGTELMPVDAGPVTVDKLDAYALTVCQKSNKDEAPPNTGQYLFVRSGNPARSWISIISNQRTPAAEQQMPPIVTHAVDVAGHKLLDDWITALTPACP